MLIDYVNGQSGIILRILVQQDTTGANPGYGFTGLANTTTGLNVSTIADAESSVTTYTSAGSTIQTIATLGSYAAPSASDCRLGKVDDTNLPGLVEIQLANARYAVSGAKSLVVFITGVAGMMPCRVTVPLRVVNPYDVNFGVQGLKGTTNPVAGQIPTVGTAAGQINSDSSGSVPFNNTTIATAGAVTGAVGSVTGNVAGSVASVSGAVGSVTGNVGGSVASVTGAVGSVTGSVGSVTAGVTVTTNNDKTGYSLTQTFPTNFSVLGISAGGHISNVDTLTTYTGDTPQTGDSYARIGSTRSGLTSLAPAATALSTVVWTSTIAGYLTGAVATAAGLTALQSHGDSTWATATGFATPTNIMGGTITNLANAPTAGSFTAAMVAQLNASTPSVTVGALGAGAITAAAFAAASITDAAFAVPPEAAGRPTTFLAMLRRAWEWVANKRVRNRATGEVQLIGQDGETVLEAQTQSSDTIGDVTIDTQTQGS